MGSLRGVVIQQNLCPRQLVWQYQGSRGGIRSWESPSLFKLPVRTWQEYSSHGAKHRLEIWWLDGIQVIKKFRASKTIQFSLREENLPTQAHAPSLTMPTKCYSFPHSLCQILDWTLCPSKRGLSRLLRSQAPLCGCRQSTALRCATSAPGLLWLKTPLSVALRSCQFSTSLSFTEKLIWKPLPFINSSPENT